MHYLLDGYNLLFELNDDEFHLESGRQEFIDELEAKVSSAGISVTLVFDGRFRMGDVERNHYRSLEILFSSYGETADELILSEIEESDDPRHEVVVTRDRDLIWRAKRLHGKSQSPSEFLKWLKKKSSQQKKLKFKTPQVKNVQKPEKVYRTKENELLGHYLAVFEEKLAQEPPPKKTKISVVDDYSRWLELFEKRLDRDE